MKTETLTDVKKDRDALVEAAKRARELIDECGHQPSTASTCQKCSNEAVEVLKATLGDRW